MPPNAGFALLAKKTVCPDLSRTLPSALPKALPDALPKALLGPFLCLAFLLASFALPSLAPLGQVAHAAPAGNSGNSGNSGGQVYNNVPYPGFSSYIGSYAPTSGNANAASVLITRDFAGFVYGGFSNSGNATHNTLLVNGGSVLGSAIGGFSHSGNATNNSVLVSGGSVGLNVYGGYSSFGNATHNSVTILGKPVFSTTSVLYGGYSLNPASTGDLRTGNTLNVFSSDLEAKNIANFQHYKFLLQANSNVKLNLLDVAGTDLGGNLNPAPTLAVPYAVSGAVLPVNRNITLLQSAGPLSNVPVLNNGQAVQGVSLIYDYSLAQSGNSIVATVNSVQANPQAKALSQGRLAGLASLWGPTLWRALA